MVYRRRATCAGGWSCGPCEAGSRSGPGEREQKRAPLAHFAFHPNPPAVQVYNHFAEGQTQAGGLAARGAADFRLAELFKYPREGFAWDAAPGVPNREWHSSLAGRAVRGQSDLAALGRELDGVTEQVGQHTDQFVFVHPQNRQVVGNFSNQRQIVLVQQRKNLLERVRHQISSPDLLHLQPERAAFHFADVEQVIDHPQQGLAAGLRDAQKLLLIPIQVADQRNHLKPRQKRSQRRPQILDNHVHQVITLVFQRLMLRKLS